eukprot:9471424-Pyramimonas_sp.AAC.2
MRRSSRPPKAAYRTEIDNPKKVDWSLPLKPVKAHPNKEMIARWSDGCEWKIPGLTNQEWIDEHGTASSGGKGAAKVFEGVLKADNNVRVWVDHFSRHGQDHVAMWEQKVTEKKGLKCQLICYSYLPDPDDLFKDFGKRYCAGKLTKEKMEEEKRDYITKHAPKKESVPVKKRPAAASRDDAERDAKTAKMGNNKTAIDTKDPKLKQPEEAAEEKKAEEEEEEEDEEEEEGAEVPVLRRPAAAKGLGVGKRTAAAGKAALAQAEVGGGGGAAAAGVSGGSPAKGDSNRKQEPTATATTPAQPVAPPPRADFGDMDDIGDGFD